MAQGRPAGRVPASGGRASNAPDSRGGVWQAVPEPAAGGQWQYKPPPQQIAASIKASTDYVDTWQWMGKQAGARVNMRRDAWSEEKLRKRVQSHDMIVRFKEDGRKMKNTTADNHASLVNFQCHVQSGHLTS